MPGALIVPFTRLLIGFSVVSALVLLIAYLFLLPNVRRSALGAVACTALLAALIGLQLAHWWHLETAGDPFGSTWYVLGLFATPIAFYYFSREVLLEEAGLSGWWLVHLAPLALVALLPPRLAVLAAFAIGAGYCVWFARIVFTLRRRQRRFRFEMFFFGLFAVIAVLVLLLVVAAPRLGTSLFFLAYANAISLSFVLIVAALIVFPELLDDVSDAARLTYAKTTLGDVDVPAALARLEQAMAQERLYRDENLTLAQLAQAVGLSPHQLSELINRHLGCGFSRYVRERRVAEAKTLLRDDPRASVLSIGLATGFRSQSSFYAAFRELTGEAPGAYRKQRAAKPPR